MIKRISAIVHAAVIRIANHGVWPISCGMG